MPLSLLFYRLTHIIPEQTPFIMFNKLNSHFFVLIGLLLFLSNCGEAQTTELKVGDNAPTFEAKASLNGQEIDFSLKEALKNGPVVVYFYPAAYTNGCDLEAKTFADRIADFEEANTTVVGVSADDIDKLNIFSADPEFCAGKFPVVSDENAKIANTFGLEMSPPRAGAVDNKGNEITHGFLPRTTFVLGSDGKVLNIFSSQNDGLSPVEHVEKSLALVQQGK